MQPLLQPGLPQNQQQQQQPPGNSHIQVGGPNQQQQQQPFAAPPPPSGQDWTLSSVLHYLQSEWRRYERDRNEFDIERAEMRARIALLEGERRSFENIKLDLMRRIKMLEYALRVERSPRSATGLFKGHSKSNLSKEDVTADAEKPGSDMHLDSNSGASPNGAPAHVPASQSNPGPTWAGGTSTNAQANMGLGRPPTSRDPKSRAKSRDYLKQCLQEITYLTSNQAVNPLPNRQLLSLGASASAPNLPPPSQVPSVPSSQPQQNAPVHTIPSTIQLIPATQNTVVNGRPRKSVPDVSKDVFLQPPPAVPIGPVEPLDPANNQFRPITVTIPDASPEDSQPETHSQSIPQPSSQPQAASSELTQSLENTAAGPVLAAVAVQAVESRSVPEPNQVTAIFRPDDAGEWRERLRAAHESQQAMVAQSASKEDELADMESTIESITSDGSSGPTASSWKVKRTLRSHLDAVRALSFHPTELSLATGGDDNTIKIWRMDPATVASSSARPTTEIEPQITLRGHTQPITALVHSPARRLLYSASIDATIRVWSLPAASRTTYAPFEASTGVARATLVGHTDAIWDIALVRNETTLVSCGGDGAVKVWDVSSVGADGDGGGHLKLSWGYHGLTEDMDDDDTQKNIFGATTLDPIKTDLKKVAVAFRDAIVKFFDVETGVETGKLQSDISYDGTSRTQINKITSHPTMPLLVTAHEDRYIRIFDVITEQCTHSMLAHTDSVTSLSIDPSGFTLVTSGHDCSVRFWDLLTTRACIQESTTHRKKADEGVLAVAFHPGSLPFLASAGADGIVKLYATS
ncbi:WD40-repeat-containing domain protein [Cantharellus anzutake]|uniref:WD40-repeat-containing domain protein n=1 Tax=Cantharellus anzutake TaxID=1750568 RepID=UPI0019086047|nr:WD40-repeat-containing domain protein [Cantharellus anzutake]KAF8321420.1 WD40-repeat-containing domain protein [Cantharellus anzutake]